MLLPVYERTPGYSLGIQKRFLRWDGCHDTDNPGEFCCASDALTPFISSMGDLTTFTQREVKALKATAVKILSEPTGWVVKVQVGDVSEEPWDVEP